jgi:hypothetical protein
MTQGERVLYNRVVNLWDVLSDILEDSDNNVSDNQRKRGVKAIAKTADLLERLRRERRAR